jgi:hypothetical protein
MAGHSVDVSRRGITAELESAAEQASQPGEKLRLKVAARLIPAAYDMLRAQSDPGTFSVTFATTAHAHEALAGKRFEVIKFSKTWKVFPTLDYSHFRALVVRIQDDSVKDLEMSFPIDDPRALARCAEIQQLESAMGLHTPSHRFLEGVSRSDAGCCAYCKRWSVLQSCRSCKRVMYCSQACQIAEWPDHKADCQKAGQILTQGP